MYASDSSSVSLARSPHLVIVMRTRDLDLIQYQHDHYLNGYYFAHDRDFDPVDKSGWSELC